MKKIVIGLVILVLTLLSLTACGVPSESAPTAEPGKAEESSKAQADSAEMQAMSDEKKKEFRTLLNQMAERFIVLQGEVGLAYAEDGKTAVTDTINGEPMNLVEDPRFSNLSELKTWLGEKLSPDFPPYAALLNPEKTKTATYQEKDGKLYVRIVAAVYDFSKESQEKANYLISQDGCKAEIQLPAQLTGALTHYQFEKQNDTWLLVAVK